MRTSTTILASAVALISLHAVIAQRSSPQFSFPAPGSLASQFGADVFGPSAQELGQLNQAGASSSGGGDQSTSAQLIAQSAAQPGQPGRAAEQQVQSQPLQQQASRPSLSLPAPQQASRQSQAAQQSASAQSAAAANREPQAHQSNRHHVAAAAQPAQAHRPSSSASTHHATPAAAAPARGHHPANLQTQQTSQSLNAQNNQAAIEAARKAEATAASLAASSGQSYHCPDSFGFFRHHKSCDKYWACENGTAALKLCGNGLMFDDSDPKRENCAYPFSVDCGADRTDLEPPISTPHCPRLYGLFADTTNCRVFYSCWNGEASKYECPPGLAYDNEQRVCVWADLVERCDQSEVSDGFVCPDPTEVDQPGHYTRHAHPTDCRKFYVCIEGVARPYGCSFGTVFNVDSLQCDEPENVGGCEKYYGDMDPKLAKKLARENAQGAAAQTPVGSGGSRGAPSSAATSAAH